MAGTGDYQPHDVFADDQAVLLHGAKTPEQVSHVHGLIDQTEDLFRV